MVERQKGHAKGFVAAPSAIRGNVLEWQEPWTLPQGELTVICRNNAPLFSLAMRLLRKRVPVAMIGRDIGKNLIRLASKILPDAGNLLRALDLWEAEECQKNPKRAESISDKAESLRAIAEDCTTKKEVLSALNEIFSSSSARVTLTSGHRAKGLEWNTVLHLDPWRIPSKYAKQKAHDGDKEALRQEMNLKYVIETRTKQTLILANLDQFDKKENET